MMPISSTNWLLKSEDKNGAVFIHEHCRGKIDIRYMTSPMVRLYPFNQSIGDLIREKYCTYDMALLHQIYAIRKYPIIHFHKTPGQLQNLCIIGVCNFISRDRRFVRGSCRKMTTEKQLKIPIDAIVAEGRTASHVQRALDCFSSIGPRSRMFSGGRFWSLGAFNSVFANAVPFHFFLLVHSWLTCKVSHPWRDAETGALLQDEEWHVVWPLQ